MEEKEKNLSDYKKLIITVKKRKVEGIKKRVKFIYIRDEKGRIKKTFIYDRERKQSLEATKTLSQIDDTHASKESIRKYFQKRAEKEGIKYNPKNPDELLVQEKNFINNHIGKSYVRSVKTFKNENQLIFTNKRKITNFEKNKIDYTYVQVDLRIYFDGHYIETSGKGRNYSHQLTNTELREEIHQAILNGLAPYGSNLKFDLLRWNYVYHVNNSMII